MKSLYLSLKHLPENLPAKFHQNENAWGKLELFLDDGLERIDLLSLEWYLFDFARWFTHSHLPNLYDEFALFNRGDNENISEFLQNPTSKQRYYYQYFYDSHCLQRTFSFSLVFPKIVIAVDKKPLLGEISLIEKLHGESDAAKMCFPEPPWAYPFDMKQYHQDARWEMLQFLEQWCELAPNREKKKQAIRLFREILASPEP